MDLDQLLASRRDLLRAVLLDEPASQLRTPDWRIYGAGFLVVGVAGFLSIWTSFNQPEPGFYARISLQLLASVGAAVWMVSASQAAEFLIMRVALRAHSSVRQIAVTEMLKTDASLFHRYLRVKE